MLGGTAVLHRPLAPLTGQGLGSLFPFARPTLSFPAYPLLPLYLFRQNPSLFVLSLFLSHTTYPRSRYTRFVLRPNVYGRDPPTEASTSPSFRERDG